MTFYILGWLLCSIIGFWLWQDQFREEFDLLLGEAIGFGLLSIILGPFFLLIALILWVLPKIKFDFSKIILKSKR